MLTQVDYAPLTHAVHRLSGIITPVNAAASAKELEDQLRSSRSIALFTCLPLLRLSLQAAKVVGLPEDRVFILPMANNYQTTHITVDDLVCEGRGLPELAPEAWTKGQGKKQVAYLSYSSGTSGLPVRMLS
jgi:long-subunit acyl-CoA synthetase (AMP-forming)